MKDDINDPTAGSDGRVGRLRLSRPTIIKLIIVGGAIGAIGVLYYLFQEQLSLSHLVAREGQLRRFRQDFPAATYTVAFLIYVVVTGFSLPGAAPMTMVFGWYFGFLPAVLLVSFASTTGATLAFLMSRYLLRDAIQRRFGDRLRTFNEALEREGAFYLFTLRLIPAVPFFAINAVMGVTKMRVATFWWVSQLGMLAGTCVYVYAGSTVPSLEQIADRSQLSVDDIRDWPGFVQQLAAANNATQRGPTTELWRQLSAETQTIIQRDAGQDEIPADDKRRIVRDLNLALKHPDFALRQPWQSAELKSSEVTRFNRTLLVNTLPAYVIPPRSILSWRLIAAFAALGVFPLAVKKLLGWIQARRRAAEPNR